ncbi:mechanosensitive ion channel [Luteolibacter ambystomatis]|uniref:Mechanosensitive ion channel n=1 Tax=Luteolibacter ambystomatis TaxID=2824561 RepID=A0A975IZV7_9BACT|nr:mechanosensitive ion channel domain-containing protein [Luteolibacter ambystomatis]QUE50385.1 mechanosensitive ion channel [Luteolibacter ambystomatis]
MIRALAATFLLLSGSIPLHAQLSNLLAKDAPKQAEVAETPQQMRDRWQAWLDDAKAQLVRLDDPAAETQLPAGVTTGEYADRRRDMQSTMASLERCLKSKALLDASAKEATRAREARADWHGFKEPPPYSVLLVDDLRNQRDVAHERKNTAESSISLMERMMEEARQLSAKADADVRRAEEAAASNDKDMAAKWRLDAAKVRQRMLVTRIESANSGIAVQRNDLAAAMDDLSLAEIKISAAAAQQAFLKDDLDKIRKAAADRQTALRKEVEGLDKRRRAVLAERRKLEPVPGADGKTPPADELTRLKLDGAQDRADALEFSVDLLGSLGQLENQMLEAYDARHTLMTSTDPDARAAARKSLGDILNRVGPWETFVDNQFNLAGAKLRSQEAKASSLAADDPKLQPINDVRDALGEQMAVIQRVKQGIDLATRLIHRWLEDYDKDVQKQSWGERTSSFFRSVWRGIRSVWQFEVFHVDNKGVTLGRLVIALLLFAFGYFVASRITRRLQRAVVARGRVAEAQAGTLRRWLMVLLGFFLVVGTLQVMKIPLTVFAFFGGALAIGLGFGTQTLIKNFISGIIMLFERNIRVGDIVDVGGSVGTVSEINTRSSIIRSVDGLETVVPNSMFLENKITNWTHTNRRLRRSIRIGVSYGSPSQKVADILVDCANRHGKVLKDPEPMALFEDFGDNALLFSLYFWVELAGNTNAALVSSDLRFMIEKRLTEAGIGIPFPQRDLRLVTETPLQVEWAPRPEDAR